MMQKLMWIVRSIIPCSCKIFGHEFETYQRLTGTHKQCCMQCGEYRSVKDEK